MVRASAARHRGRLLGLVYGLYGRFRGAIPIAFYVRVQSRAALKNKSFVLEPRGSRQWAAYIGRERALPWYRGTL